MNAASATPQAAPRDATLALALRAVALLMGGFLLFALAIALGAKGTDVWISGVAVLTVVLTLGPLVLDTGRPPEKRQLLLSLIGVAYCLSFAVPVVTEYFLTGGQMTGIAGLAGLTPEDVLVGQTGALAGWVVFLIGFFLPVGGQLAKALPQPRREWSHNQALAVALVLIPLGWALFMAGQLRIIPARAGSGVLGAFASSLYFGIAILTVTYLRYRSQASMLLLVVLVPPTIALSFFTGSKTLALAPLMMIAFTHIVVTRRIKRTWVIGGTILIVVLYPANVFLRQVVSQGNRLNIVALLSRPDRTISLMSRFVQSAEFGEYMAAGLQATGNRLNALGITAVIMHDTPSRVPFQDGRTIGLIFVSYVPRILWADKPVTTIGRWVTSNYGAGPHIESHTGPSWIGELYLNFGYPGIAFGMLIIGIWFRLLQAAAFRPNATIPLIVFGVILLQATVLSVQAGLIGILNNVTFKSIPLVMAHIAVRLLTRPPRTLPATSDLPAVYDPPGGLPHGQGEGG